MAVKVSGVKELRKKLRELPKEIKADLHKELEKGAAEMVAMAKRLVPVDQGKLQNSIGFTWGEPPKGSIVLASSRGPGDEVITIYAGDEEAFYARWVEFGTVKMAAHPYFYPSWRALRKRIKGRNKRAVKKAIEKVANGGQ